MRRLALAFLLLAPGLGASRFLSMVTGAGFDDGESGALLMKRGDEASWKKGLRQLLQARHALLREEMEAAYDSLPQAEKPAAAAAIMDLEGIPASTLLKFAMDPGLGLQFKALQQLAGSADPGALDALELIGQSLEVSNTPGWIQERVEIEWLKAFTLQFGRRFREETGLDLGRAGLREAAARGLTRSAGLDLLENWIKKGSLNTDWRFHYYGPLESYPHPRASEILLSAVRADPQGQAGLRARESLVRRGDMRIFDEAMESLMVKALASQGYGGDLENAAWYFGEEAILPLFEKLKRETETPRARLWIRALQGAGYSEDPEKLKIFEAHKKDPNPLVRRAAAEALAWPRIKRVRLFKQAFERSKGQLVQVASSLLALGVGALVFLLAFRVLKLRALLSTLRPAPAAALATGLARLKGEAQPATGYLKHPDTGELCLYYPGAEKKFPHHRFYLVDQGGRVLIQPRGGLLLGGDSVITPGESLTVVGFATPSSDPAALSAGGRPMALGCALDKPSLRQQALRFLMKALLGFGPRSEAVRMLFADPRDFFFIWEDQARDPLSAPGTRAAAMGAMALAGLWSLVFFTLAAASATQKLDEVVLMGLGLLSALI